MGKGLATIEMNYEAMRERDRVSRLRIEQMEKDRLAAMSPMELAQENIEQYIDGYGWDFDQLKEMFKQYLEIEAGETP